MVAQVSVGIKAGVMLVNRTVTSLNFKSIDRAKLSYLGGGFMTIPLYEKCNLQIELLYANKGIGNVDILVRTDYHYMNLPVLLQYRIADRLWLEAGPEVGYLLAYRQFLTQGTGADNDIFARDFDVAINLGAGYDISDRVHLNLRYNLGVYDVTKPFSEVFTTARPGVPDNPKTINRSVQLSVGFRLF